MMNRLKFFRRLFGSIMGVSIFPSIVVAKELGSEKKKVATKPPKSFKFFDDHEIFISISHNIYDPYYKDLNKEWDGTSVSHFHYHIYYGPKNKKELEGFGAYIGCESRPIHYDSDNSYSWFGDPFEWSTHGMTHKEAWTTIKFYKTRDECESKAFEIASVILDEIKKINNGISLERIKGTVIEKNETGYSIYHKG